MRAAKKGNVGIVKMLIQHEANVNLTNKVMDPVLGVCISRYIIIHCYQYRVEPLDSMYSQNGSLAGLLVD